MDFKKAKKKSQEVNQSTLAMSSGTLLSRILGFIRDMVIGFLFNRTETDAFFVAFRFPNFFRRFFGEGALTVSFVPVFIECLYGSDSEENNLIQAKNLMNSIYTLLLICISVLTAAGVLYMDSFIHWMFDHYSFSSVEGKMDMTIFLSQVLFFYLFLVVTYAYYTAIANALHCFFIPALAPAIFNLTIILFILFFPKDSFVYSTTVLALGVLIGGVLQTAMVAYTLIRLKFFPVLRLSLMSQKLKVVFNRFVLAIIGVGGFALIGVLNVFFAGWLEEGAHTYIYYGDRLLEFPRSLVSVSMGTALLPTLSKLFVQKKQWVLVELAAHQRDILLYVIAPCALGLFLLGVPMLEVLFERGKFDREAVLQTAEVLKIYSYLLVILSLVQLLSSCFYSVKNTWLPALSTLAGLTAHVVFAPLLISFFQLKGLIWATTASSCVQLILLLCTYPRFIGSFYWKRTALRFLKTIPFLTAFGFYLKYMFDGSLYIFELSLSEGWGRFLALFFTGISAVVLYGCAGVYFKLVQAREFVHLFKNKFRSSFQPRSEK